MTTSDQNQSQTQGGEQGTGSGAADSPQQGEAGGGERGGGSARHGRRRRGGRPEQQQQQRPQQSQQQQRRSDSGLNLDELRELTELFSTHGLTDFEFENADIRIRLSRNPAPSAAAAQSPAPAPSAAMQAQASAGMSGVPTAAATPAPQEAPPPAPAAPPEAPEEELHVITSPIVGTFYRASSPTTEPFIKVGSQVEPDSVVCIIEAMKLMNEIQAETTGTVAKIYVENGQPVEYGQPLFGVKK
jgi:acetyl-CoA carboxylase biotin carboxyl carrier protein